MGQEIRSKMVQFLQDRYGFEMPGGQKGKGSEIFSARFDDHWNADTVAFAVDSARDNVAHAHGVPTAALTVFEDDMKQVTDRAFRIARAAKTLGLSAYDEAVRAYVKAEASGTPDSFNAEMFHTDKGPMVTGEALLLQAARETARISPQLALPEVKRSR